MVPGAEGLAGGGIMGFACPAMTRVNFFPHFLLLNIYINFFLSDRTPSYRVIISLS